MAETTLNPAKDVAAHAENPDTNQESGTFHIEVAFGGAKGSTTRLNTYMEFDATAYAGGGADLISARLELYVTNFAGGSNAQLNRLSRDSNETAGNQWLEDQATWNSWKTGNAWSTGGGTKFTGGANDGALDIALIASGATANAYNNVVAAGSATDFKSLIAWMLDNRGGYCNLVLWVTANDGYSLGAHDSEGVNPPKLILEFPDPAGGDRRRLLVA